MSVNATPAVQVLVVDPAVTLTPSPLQSGGTPLYCANGAVNQDATLPAATSLLPLAFPVGVTTAVYIFVASVTATDLKVNVGSSPFPVPIPLGQGITLYGLTSAQVSVSSVLGGKIQYSVGG